MGVKGFTYEPHHESQIIWDYIRDTKIKDKFGCKIIRIKEKEFMNNINQSTLKDFEADTNVKT